MLFKGQTLSVTLDDNGIGHFVFDAAGSVNKFDQQTIQECRDAAKAINADDTIKGVVFKTAKNAFIVGADITEFLETFKNDEATLVTWVKASSDMFDAIEDIKVPTVTAIRGFALGGGFELCLATDMRIADATAQVGLPENNLGLIPGFGGTVRLPRIIGPDNALEWITSARPKSPKDALKMGAIDAVTSSENLDAAALSMLNSAIAGKLDWQAKRQQKLDPIKFNATELENAVLVAKTMVMAKAGKHYPAPVAAVDSVYESAGMHRDDAMRVENKYFAKLAKTNAATAMIGNFLNDQYVKGLAKKAAKGVTKPLNKAAVLGAGIMGGGIAYQSASKGTPIVMKDINQGALDQGLAEATKILDKKLSRGHTTGAKMANVLNNIIPTLNNESLADVDFVIEAVVENPKVKGAVLAETETHVGSDTILTSNTSTISINLLAKSLARPENFCGMHFFNPVPRMPLVEIIRGEKTSDETIASTVAYAAKMGKTPIVVNDCPGFFVNRVLFPYFAGFSLLLNDGANFVDVDKVMEREFGWPMGPAMLLDVVGIDTADHCTDVMSDGFPTRMPKLNNDPVTALYKENRYGQKNGKGFYDHTLDKRGKPKKDVNPETLELLKAAAPSNQKFDKLEVINRLMIPMVNETIRCLEEGIIASPAEADLALLYGVGFPPFRGGIFRFVDTMGLAEFVAEADKYAALGEIYQVTDKTREMAKSNQTFYSTYGAK
ncbi:fatty acid oxidation complex subunit alpha FadB [Psychrosphaera sp. B3R10]|uniref:fatty acid oxidation complex subunit alpha FadB n=1 Tax=unclassified Psychrosphaera TaxID=2641570 RepID=UPI001C09280B|nr:MULTISPECIES: fatty acid oxidation complex subunit alpha FadB [unclassified Psychrosphaera]MBU2883289.1 fatty acid oxidation complex subunit alpha FadB [Psychrosphaera sp. I2R16]MBU2990617.1 fatty acid oxidation complex subunit alpha FadB [Psychrosphaera sp. B3R10]